MLDFDAVLELMKKYGYSSTSIHPYIYQNGDNIGICYTYIDEEYGLLERIKIFDNIEAFEEFLKEQSWLKSNGKNYNVRMILDNYESSMPKVLYLRNEKVMVEGEMADIDNFDLRESQRKQMDEVSQILYEAGDLLLVYDEIKERQLQYLQKLIELKNVLRGKYFDLQKEVDAYNNYKVERNLTLIPDVLDKGSINEVLEVAIKDQYNMYIANRPSLDEIKDFIKQVWDLNLNLELNTKYYEAQKEENDIRNEIKVVDKKLELMNSLKEELKPLFGIDLVGRFKKINDECRKESKYMSKNYVEEHLALVNKKYSVYDKLNLLYASDYLREAIQNTNYDDLAIKYSVTSNDEEIDKVKLPLNEVVADLAIQYRDKLSVDEQSILVLYNNSKFAKLFDRILEMDNYETLPIKNVIRGLSSIKGLSKIKTECYENVKKRIDDPVNDKIKNSLFSNVDFTTFETFIASLIKKLAVLKNVNSKMTIKSDFNMYTLVSKGENVPGRKYVSVTNDLNTLLNEAKENRCMIGICLLKEGLPVLYSPYYFDLGDMYSKGASPLMEIKEMINFDLLIEVADTTVFVDENKVEVARYYTEPKMNENISYVDDIKLAYSTTFCKYSFVSNLPVSSEVAVPSNDVAVAPVVSTPEVVEQPTEVASAPEGVATNEVSEPPKVETPVVEEKVAEAPSSEVQSVEENKEEAAEVKKEETKPVILEETEKTVEVEPKEEKAEPATQEEKKEPEVKQKVKEEAKPVIETKEAPVVIENKTEVVNKEESAKEKPVTKETAEKDLVPAIEEKKEEIPVESKTTEVVATNEVSKPPKVKTPVVEVKPVTLEKTEKPIEQPIEKPKVVEKTLPVIEEKKEETPSPIKVEEVKKDVSKTVNENKVFATFDSSQSTSNEVKTGEKQEVATEDFKTVTTNTEVNKSPLLPNQKNVKIVKKVSSVGASTTNNNEAFSKEVSIPTPEPPKKNIVVKSVGSIGKPLNK